MSNRNETFAANPARRRFLRIGVPVLVLAIAAGGFFALRATRPSPLPVTVEEKVWLVDATPVSPGRNTPQLSLYATAEAPSRAELTAAIAADVAQVLTAEGWAVAAKQPLIVLDDRDINLVVLQRDADVAEIQAMIESERHRHAANLDSLQREKALLELANDAVERAQDLYRRSLGSRALVDEARRDLERQALLLDTRQLAVNDHEARLAQLEARKERAEALRDQAILDRERTRISAPFAGRIVRVPIAPGDRVRVGDVLAEIYSSDSLELRAQIPFRYLPVVRSALNNGAALTAETQVDGGAVRAVLDRLGGEVDKAGGGVDVLFQVTDGQEFLAPGRLIPLQMELPDQEQTVLLPYEALYGLKRVYRLDGGRLVAVDVNRVGERRLPDGSVHVLVRSPDLHAGDQVITTQLPNAVNGLRVTLAEQSVASDLER